MNILEYQKDEANISKDIFDAVITRSEAAQIVTALKNAAEEMFKTKGDIVTSLKESLPSKVFDTISRYLSQTDVTHMPDVFEKLVENAGTYALHVPILQLTTAIDPRRAFLEQIAFSCQQEVKQKIFIQVNVNPFILGGVIIQWQGKYGDYSLQGKIYEKNSAQKNV